MAALMAEPVDALIGPKLIALNWTMTVLAAIVVALRLFEKTRKTFKLWWDDYIAFVSWTLLLALSISLTFEVKRGLGRHMSELSSMVLEGFSLSIQLASTIAIAGTSLSKTGFAVTLLKYSEGRLRRLVWLTIGLVNIVSGVSGTIIWVQCTPLRKNFEPSSPGTCFPGTTRVAIQIFNTSVSGTADIALVVLALCIIRGKFKTMKRPHLIGVAVCSLLGVFAGLSSYFKAMIMHVLLSNDITFELIPLFSWGVVEPALLLVAGSLPELRDFTTKAPPRARRPRRYDLEQFNYLHDEHTGNAECQTSSEDVGCGQRQSVSDLRRSVADMSPDPEYDFARQQYADAGQKTFMGQEADYKRPGSRMDGK